MYFLFLNKFAMKIVDNKDREMNCLAINAGVVIAEYIIIKSTGNIK